MKKRDPMMDYIVALLSRVEGEATLSSAELQKARKKNFSITLSKEYVKLALIGKPPSIMPFNQQIDRS